LAKVPGAQKLAPLSSADDEGRPIKVANAATAAWTSKLGKRFLEATATSHPPQSQRPNIVRHPFKYTRPRLKRSLDGSRFLVAAATVRAGGIPQKLIGLAGRGNAGRAIRTVWRLTYPVWDYFDGRRTDARTHNKLAYVSFAALRFGGSISKAVTPNRGEYYETSGF
jgi:hypothetical protein